MARQRLTLSKTIPVMIETPEGMITINFMGSRKVEIDLPGDMVANMGDDRAWKEPRFLARRADGAVLPTYTALIPRLDQNGALAGLETARIRRLAVG